TIPRTSRSTLFPYTTLFRSLDHADAGGRVQAVGGFVQEQQFGAVGDGLRQFGGLLHAERIGTQVAVAHFAQAHVKEGFVGALEGDRKSTRLNSSHLVISYAV